MSTHFVWDVFTIDGVTNNGTSLHDEVNDASTTPFDFAVNTSAILMELLTTDDPSTSTTRPPVGSPWEPGISEAAVKSFSYITKSFVTPPVCLIGFIGNILGVGVLWRQAKQQKLSIFWYLSALTFMDIIFLGLGIAASAPVFVSIYDSNLSKYLVAHMKRALSYFDMISLHTARLTVLVMSCERLLSIARPFHVKNTWFAKYPLRIILACLFFNAAFALPFLINGTVVTKHKQNRTEYVYTFRNYDTFMSQYWLVQVVVQSFIPVVILIAVNIAIPLQFYRASTRLRSALKSSPKDSLQGKITATVMSKMLCTSCCPFL